MYYPFDCMVGKADTFDMYCPNYTYIYIFQQFHKVSLVINNLFLVIFPQEGIILSIMLKKKRMYDR